MAFAKMIKNREWEKVFDILDQGKIEKKNQTKFVGQEQRCAN